MLYKLTDGRVSLSQLVPKDLIGETRVAEITFKDGTFVSQLVPKDLIGETIAQAVMATAAFASQLVPKDLIGETDCLACTRRKFGCLNWSRRTSLVRRVVVPLPTWSGGDQCLNWSRRTSLVRPHYRRS